MKEKNENYINNLNDNSSDIYSNYIKGYLQEIKSLKYQLEKEKNKNEELQKLYDTLGRYNEDLTQKNNFLELNNNEINIEKKKKEDFIITLQKQISQISRENINITSLKQENIKIKNHNKELEILFNESSKKFQFLKEKYNNIKNQMKEMTNSYDTCLSNMSLLIKKNEELEIDYNKFIQKFNNKKNLNLKLKKQISNFELILNENNNKINSLEKFNKELILKHSKELENLETKIFQQSIEIEDYIKMKSQFEKQKNVIKITTEKLTSSQSENKKLNQEFQNTKEILLQNNSELQNILENNKFKYSQKIEELSNQLNENKQLSDSLSLKLNHTEEKLEKTKNLLNETRSQFSESFSLSQSSHQQQLSLITEKLEKSQKLCKELASQLGNSPTKQQLSTLKEKNKFLEEENELLINKIELYFQEKLNF